MEHNLVDVSDLEAANERLLEYVQEGIGRRTSILGLLVWEMNTLSEADLIRLQFDEYNLAPLDLDGMEWDETGFSDVSPDACWATWTVPFDRKEGFTFLATAYYLSSSVIEYWEEFTGGPVIWYGATMEGLGSMIEAREKELSKRR